MPDFPDDAVPGEIHPGPDGHYHLLQWSGDWTRVTREAWREQRRRLQEEERAEWRERALEAEAAAARRAQLAAAAAASTGSGPDGAFLPGPRVPSELPLSPFAEAERDGGREAVTYADEYQDVIDEAEGWARADGWTAERRLLFLERLAEGGSVRRAAQAAGVTRQAVWKLRRRAPAFDAAYRQVMAETVELLAETAMDRALHGSEVPVFHEGELVGTRIVHHDRLLAYLLRVRDPLNFAPVDELERWQRHRPLVAAASPLGRSEREGGFSSANGAALPPPPPNPPEHPSPG